MNKQMNSFTAQAKKKTPPVSQNFLEILKDGNSQPNPQATKIQELLRRREERVRHQERTRFETIRREEKIIFSRQQEQVKLQIETLQTQIKQLAKEHTGLLKEVEKASFQAVVNPGVYHQNFFERLLQLIKLAQKKISESRTWLHLHNHRAKKRAYYWQNVKKSGTKFMLSQERTVSTQSG
jgi:hypothetical protein